MPSSTALDIKNTTSSRSYWNEARGYLESRLSTGSGGVPDMVEDILSGLLNISSEGIILTDDKHKIILFSNGAEVIFGWKAEDIIGQPLHVLIAPELREDHVSLVEGFGLGPIHSRRMGKSRGVTGYTRDGRLVPVEVGLSKTMTRSGVIYTALVRDISESIKAEAALNQALSEATRANQAKSAFLATMSHEVRTPLNGILGMAQAMAFDSLPPKQSERLEIIRSSGQTLLDILNDVLDLSKIEAGKLDLDTQAFDLEGLIDRTHETFSALAMQKGLTFKVYVRENAKGTYMGDPLRIRQVLNNLTSNAIKFTDRGEVRIIVETIGGELAIKVADTGIGIPAEIQEHIFNKFEQGDLSPSRRHGGTGLGLSICRDLVQLMGGHISVHSLPGSGSSFCVRLPLQYVGKPEKPQSFDLIEPAHETEVNQLRLLVAEDNRANQLVIDTLLRQAGITPVIVSDGRAAVSAWEDEPWDLILMDVQMPEMDGPTATAIIRRRELDRHQARTPILALTANAMDHQLAEYRFAGMDGLIAKPIDVEKLFSAIKHAIQPRLNA
jgi:PAS domain S-box-containing protein